MLIASRGGSGHRRPHRPRQPPGADGRPRARRLRQPAARRWSWPSSTSTASRPTTTASATPPATTCCAGSAASWPRRRLPTVAATASAATSSASSPRPATLSAEAICDTAEDALSDRGTRLLDRRLLGQGADPGRGRRRHRRAAARRPADVRAEGPARRLRPQPDPRRPARRPARARARAGAPPRRRRPARRRVWPPARLDAEELDVLVRAAELHDIGKIAIPDEILHKDGDADRGGVGADAQAPADRRARARSRPGPGRRWRSWSARPTSAGTAAATPTASLAARSRSARRAILICDAYNAMTEGRPYRAAMSSEAGDRGAAPRRRHPVRPELVKTFAEKVVPALEREAAVPRADLAQPAYYGSAVAAILDELTVADSPAAWRSAGSRSKATSASSARCGSVRAGGGRQGLTGWSLRGVESTELDGLPTSARATAHLPAYRTRGAAGAPERGRRARPRRRDHLRPRPHRRRAARRPGSTCAGSARSRPRPAPRARPSSASARRSSRSSRSRRRRPSAPGGDRPAFFWGLAFVAPDLERDRRLPRRAASARSATPSSPAAGSPPCAAAPASRCRWR